MHSFHRIATFRLNYDPAIRYFLLIHHLIKIDNGDTETSSISLIQPMIHIYRLLSSAYGLPPRLLSCCTRFFSVHINRNNFTRTPNSQFFLRRLHPQLRRSCKTTSARCSNDLYSVSSSPSQSELSVPTIPSYGHPLLHHQN